MGRTERFSWRDIRKMNNNNNTHNHNHNNNNHNHNHGIDLVKATTGGC